jgi:hypothetical protein
MIEPLPDPRETTWGARLFGAFLMLLSSLIVGFLLSSMFGAAFGHEAVPQHGGCKQIVRMYWSGHDEYAERALDCWRNRPDSVYEAIFG